jgi:FAD:protein FMN transferase
MHYREFRAMSTDILLAAEGEQEKIERGFNRAQEFIAVSEKRFTRFSPESELSQLNRAAGEWFDASAELFDVVDQALIYYQKTRGLFDPAILDVLEYIGYTRTIDELRAYGAAEPLAPVRLSPYRFSDTRMDRNHCRIALPRNMRIDLGGIAKGWIAERAAHILSNFAEACVVDAGGDAYFIGFPTGAKDWRVTLEDPRDPDRGLAILKIQPGAVATSTITRRHWQQNGKEQHHLIDPRTQQAAVTDLVSVTVIAPHAAQAEVYAKSLLIGGARQAAHLAEQAGNIEFIAVDQQNRLWGSNHSREYLDV